MQSHGTVEPLSPGTSLSCYAIREVLGKGGFGITYLALDTRLKSLVAVKEYFPSEFALRAPDRSVRSKSSHDQEMFDWGKSRFLMEAQLLAQIKHPNIVRVLALFEDNNTAYIVMDFEKGQSLADYLDLHTQPDQAFLDAIVPPLLDGLDFLHTTGFIHRDIKPENLYIRDDSTPVLLDFGSARNAMGKKTKALTTLLTPGYSPLEQYYSTSDDQGPWTDIYAFGGVLYRVVSGRNPPESALRSSSALSGRPDPLAPAVATGKGRYRIEFLEAIDKALMVLEKDRPQSVREWYAMLFPGADILKAQPAWRPDTPHYVEKSPAALDSASTTDIGDTARLNLLWRHTLSGEEQDETPGFRKILILSADELNSRNDRDALSGIAPSSVTVLASGKEGLSFLCNTQIDLVLCDATLQDMSGMQFLKQHHVWSKLLPVVMISADTRRNAVLDAIGLGASGYVVRPYASVGFNQHLQQIWRIVRFYGIEEHRLAVARDLLVKGEWDEALDTFGLVASIVEDSRDYLETAFKDLLQDQYGRATTSFRKAARIQILFAGAYKGLADTWAGKGDKKRSKEWGLKAAEAMARFNRMEKTRRMFIDVLKQQRHIPNPFNTLGVRLRHGGDYRGAIRAYQEALAIAPEDPHIHYNLARVYASNLDHDAALEQLKKALELDAEFYPAAQLYSLITGVAWKRKGPPLRTVAKSTSAAALSLIDE